MLNQDFVISKQLVMHCEVDYPVFFQPAFSTYLESSGAGNVIIVASADGVVSMPLRMFKVGYLKAAQPIYPPLRCGRRLSREDEKFFLDGLVNFLRVIGVADKIVQPPPYCVFHQPPDGAQSCRFGSYVLALRGKTEASILAGMHPDHRREIRIAAASGLRVCFGAREACHCYDIISVTMRRSSIAFLNKSEFSRLVGELGRVNAVLCGVVYRNDLPVAALVVPYSANRAFYLYGGTVEGVGVAGANKLLHWEVIRELIRCGVQEYDFVGARLSDVSGTKLEHIQRFKARFGGVLEEGCLWKISLRPKRVRFFEFLAKAKRFLLRRKQAAGDIIDQELLKGVC